MSGTVPIPAGRRGESRVRKTKTERTNPIISCVFNKSSPGKPIQSQSRGADIAARPVERPEASHISAARTDSPAARTSGENEVPAEIGRMQFVKGTARAGFGESLPAAFSFLIEWMQEVPTT